MYTALAYQLVSAFPCFWKLLRIFPSSVYQMSRLPLVCFFRRSKMLFRWPEVYFGCLFRCCCCTECRRLAVWGPWCVLFWRKCWLPRVAMHFKQSWWVVMLSHQTANLGENKIAFNAEKALFGNLSLWKLSSTYCLICHIWERRLLQLHGCTRRKPYALFPFQLKPFLSNYDS